MTTGSDNERILELVSAAADDALSAAERAELDRLLAASPEAGVFAADLRRLESLLARLPEAEPPESLRERLVSSLAQRAPRAAKLHVARLFDWLKPPAPSAVLRYGTAMAAGVVLATVILERQQRFAGPAEIQELLGTIAPSEDRGPATVLDSFGLDARGLQGLATLRSRDGALLLDIRIDADRPVEMSVDLASAGMRVEAIVQHGGGLESVAIRNGTLTARMRDRQQLTALLTRIDSPPADPHGGIGLEFFDAKGLLQRGSLKPD